MTGGIIATCATNSNKLYAYLIGSGSNLYGYAGVWVSTDEGVSWTIPIHQMPSATALGLQQCLYQPYGQQWVTGFNGVLDDMAICGNPSMTINSLLAVLPGLKVLMEVSPGPILLVTLVDFPGRIPISMAGSQWQ